MANPDMMRLLTQRLILSLLSAKDARAMLAYYNANKAHLEPWEPARSASFYSEEFWQRQGERAEKDALEGKALRLVVRLRSGPLVIGVCNFTNILGGPFQACLLGYGLDQEHQGKGLMFEALTAGTNHMFHTVGLHRIMASYIPDNTRSERLLTSLGFEKEGYAKSYLKIAGIWRDHVLTAKLNPDHTNVSDPTTALGHSTPR